MKNGDTVQFLEFLKQGPLTAAILQKLRTKPLFSVKVSQHLKCITVRKRILNTCHSAFQADIRAFCTEVQHSTPGEQNTF